MYYVRALPIANANLVDLHQQAGDMKYKMRHVSYTKLLGCKYQPSGHHSSLLACNNTTVGVLFECNTKWNQNTINCWGAYLNCVGTDFNCQGAIYTLSGCLAHM